jgi:hypothetical protein
MPAFSVQHWPRIPHCRIEGSSLLACRLQTVSADDTVFGYSEQTPMEATLGKPEGVFHNSVLSEDWRGASFSSRVLQPLQPPQLRPSQQQPDEPSLRPLDKHVSGQPGLWRRQRRLQPPLPDRRPPLHPARPQARLLVAQALLPVLFSVLPPPLAPGTVAQPSACAFFSFSVSCEL